MRDERWEMRDVTVVQWNVSGGQRRTSWQELFLWCSLTPSTARSPVHHTELPAQSSPGTETSIRSGQVRSDLPSNPTSSGKPTETDFCESNERTHRAPDWGDKLRTDGERKERLPHLCTQNISRQGKTSYCQVSQYATLGIKIYFFFCNFSSGYLLTCKYDIWTIPRSITTKFDV